MICRDEEEAERVAARLAEDVPVKNGAKGETEEFGDGVMVLPVSYTKGLEFDAVLLFDPSEKKISVGQRSCKAVVCCGNARAA